MGLTSYNPHKEVITALVGGVGFYLINHLTLKPTSIVSKIDRIRETLFGIRTRFLELIKKNTLTKYSWVFLKNVPISLATSKALSLFIYFIARTTEEAERDEFFIYVHCIKYLSFLLFFSLFVNEDLNPSPPKGRPPPKELGEEEQAIDFINRRSAYFSSLKKRHSTQPNHSKTWKDSRRTSGANLGQKPPLTPSNPGGSKFFLNKKTK